MPPDFLPFRYASGSIFATDLVVAMSPTDLIDLKAFFEDATMDDLIAGIIRDGAKLRLVATSKSVRKQ